VIIERCMDVIEVKAADSLEIVLNQDKLARTVSNRIIDQLAG
jgi:1-deoxy-D-xylulose-5-phosphate reductoisomerase